MLGAPARKRALRDYMKKRSPFDEAKPRTPRSEVRRREAQAARDIEKLSAIHDEEEFRSSLAELFGITPGHPRYEKALAIWRDLRRET
jgi:hypothetical protein